MRRAVLPVLVCALVSSATVSCSDPVEEDIERLEDGLLSDDEEAMDALADELADQLAERQRKRVGPAGTSPFSGGTATLRYVRDDGSRARVSMQFVPEKSAWNPPPQRVALFWEGKGDHMWVSGVLDGDAFEPKRVSLNLESVYIAFTIDECGFDLEQATSLSGSFACDWKKEDETFSAEFEAVR